MPEGTRSGDGRLQHARPGVVLLALKSKAPVLPIVTHGGEKYKDNLKKLRRTEFYISLGRPFTLKAANGTVDSLVRRQMLDEMRADARRRGEQAVAAGSDLSSMKAETASVP